MSVSKCKSKSHLILGSLTYGIVSSQPFNPFLRTPNRVLCKRETRKIWRLTETCTHDLSKTFLFGVSNNYVINIHPFFSIFVKIFFLCFNKYLFCEIQNILDKF